MEKKQGFFSALREELARGLSPARSRSRSESPRRGASPVADLLLPTRWKRQQPRGFPAELLVPASGSLAPLAEGPEGEGSGPGKGGWGQWMKGRLSRAPSVSGAAASCHRSDLRLLLGVMGAPLAPVHVSPTYALPHLSIKDTPIVSTLFACFSMTTCIGLLFLAFCYHVVGRKYQQDSFFVDLSAVIIISGFSALSECSNSS